MAVPWSVWEINEDPDSLSDSSDGPVMDPKRPHRGIAPGPPLASDLLLFWHIAIFYFGQAASLQAHTTNFHAQLAQHILLVESGVTHPNGTPVPRLV